MSIFLEAYRMYQNRNKGSIGMKGMWKMDYGYIENGIPGNRALIPGKPFVLY